MTDSNGSPLNETGSGEGGDPADDPGLNPSTPQFFGEQLSAVSDNNLGSTALIDNVEVSEQNRGDRIQLESRFDRNPTTTSV